MKRFISLLLVGIIALAVGCWGGVNPDDGEKDIVYLHASWVYSFDTIDDFFDCPDLDLVVLVEVTGFTDIKDFSLTTRAPYTAVELQVLDVFANYTDTEIKDSITLLHLGGERDGQLHVCPEIPFFSKGEQAILFLMERTDGAYVHLAPEARLLVENNRVYPLNHRHPNAKSAEFQIQDAIGKTVQEIEHLVRSINDR